MASTNSSKGLGKGFDALIPTDFDNSILQEPGEKVQKIARDLVKPNPDQPRKHFDDGALQELANSIKQFGIVQPLVATQSGDEYIIIAGERRWRAAGLAGLDKVPVIVRSHKELEQLEIALIENVQRVDLSPLEQAASIQKLHQQFSMSYEAIAKRLGKAMTTVNNIVRLLQLPDDAKLALTESKISEGHARAILALKDDAAKQQELLKNIVSYGWSVRQAEQFVTTTKQGAKTPKEATQRMATTTTETKKLEDTLKAPVSIRRTAKGGRLELHFTSEDDLQRILQELLG
jgi:ParB family chromosome partitioning protein